MPRRHRYWGNYSCYHITHRCHERRYLFRFEKYRDLYRRYLYEATRKFNVSVLAYVITSNHVHVVVATGRQGRPMVSEAMQHVHGEMGQHYNIARKREGSFWSNRFHATWIESGVHLQRCLFYIDMNMVRAGVAEHPSQWRHSSAHELASGQQRYRIVDRQCLCERLDVADWRNYRQWYDGRIQEILARKIFAERQPFWTDSQAVGGAEWIKQATAQSGIKHYNTIELDCHWPEGVKTFFARRKNRSKAI